MIKRRRLRSNLVGKKIGKLTVLSRDIDRFISGRPVVFYRCKCDCGNTKSILSCNLLKKTGATTSCGCKIKLPEGESRTRSTFKTYIISAKQRNLTFNLTYSQFKDITKKECHYCGCPPSNISRSHKCNGEYIYNGIDRKDNKIGYQIDNVVPCCWNCNNAKADMNEDEFFLWIKRIYNHLNK
jgi:hypothetical protein